MKRTTITLSDDLAALVFREARRRGTSVSQVVRESLERNLVRTASRKRRIPWAGIVNDPKMAHAPKLDAFLKARWTEDIDRDRG